MIALLLVTDIPLYLFDETSSMIGKGAIYFRLKEVMSKHKVRACDLADKLGVNRNTVSEWRNAKYLQAIHEHRLVQIVAAINELSKIEDEALMSDLVEINNDQLRSLEVAEYAYSNSRGRINGAPPPEAYEYVDGKKNKKSKRAA